MPIVNSSKRHQLQAICLENVVPSDHVVRVIDAFVDTLDLDELGFVRKGESKEGRPAFSPEKLLRLFIYGYINGIRSGRKLQEATQKDIYLWWLMDEQKPSYKTICDFRKDNKEVLYSAFSSLREMGLSQGLYGQHTVAIDGSKFRAQNSKKNNFNKKKIDQHIDYIDDQIHSFFEEMDMHDRRETKSLTQENQERLQNLRARKSKYVDLNNKLEQSGETQISTTDPDARALPLHRQIVEVSYNIQSIVDDQHNLIVDFEVTNVKDDHALAGLARMGNESLGLDQTDSLIVLADKGYHTAEQLAQCHEMNIDTLVAPKISSISKVIPKSEFHYHQEKDRYICPNGQILTTNGNWLERKTRNNSHPFKRYTIRYSTCKFCPFFEECVSPGKQRSSQGRYIDRYQFEEALERNAVQVNSRKSEYKRRQAIVEHPFGTIKRQWGYTYTLLKTKPKVDAEFSLIFLCYNLKRMISIMGVKRLINALNFIFYRIIGRCRVMSLHMIIDYETLSGQLCKRQFNWAGCKVS